MLSDKETYWQLKHFNETILDKNFKLRIWIICDSCQVLSMTFNTVNYLWQLSVTVIKNYLWFLFLINDVNHLNILSWIICEVHRVFIVTFNIANYLWLFSWIICEWYSASYMSGTKNKCNCHHELSLC